MKKLLYSFITLIATFGLLILSLELFSSYTPSTNIHSDAPVQTFRSIVIHASPEKVWTLLSDVNHWDKWQSDIKSPRLTSSFQPGHSFTWESGGLHIRSDIHTAVPFSKIGWSGPAFGSFAIHIWTFTPLPDGSTKVDVKESMEGWLIKLMSHKFQKGLDDSLDKWLMALKTASEKN
ncbi:MAG TPA: SRPBCC family protein [Chitinophagaceae bacterium]|jgi:hypothetical protein